MSGRFSVTYRLATADAAEARARAEAIALEQTVEIPRDIVPAGVIEDEVMGRVEAVDAVPGAHLARISYSPLSCGDELPQLLNVVFGNSSMQRGVRVEAFDPGPLAAAHPGANFGVEGMRRLTGATGPLIVPVLKPQGSDPAALAALAEACARGGAHVVKEDHGLTDQSRAPFRERVPRVRRSRVPTRRRAGARSASPTSRAIPATSPRPSRARRARTGPS